MVDYTEKFDLILCIRILCGKILGKTKRYIEELCTLPPKLVVIRKHSV